MKVSISIIHPTSTLVLLGCILYVYILLSATVITLKIHVAIISKALYFYFLNVAYFYSDK